MVYYDNSLKILQKIAFSRKILVYRAVDKSGQTVDFLLTAQRDEPAAKRFLTEAIRRHGVPEKITIDGSEANAAAEQFYFLAA